MSRDAWSDGGGGGGGYGWAIAAVLRSISPRLIKGTVRRIVLNSMAPPNVITHGTATRRHGHPRPGLRRTLQQDEDQTFRDAKSGACAKWAALNPRQCREWSRQATRPSVTRIQF